MNLLNKISYIIIYFLILIFISVNVFSIGVYNDLGEYVYYTNNPSPQFNITVVSTSQPIDVNYAELKINNMSAGLVNIDNSLNPGDEKTYYVPLSDFGISAISSSDDIFFSLNITDKKGDSIVPKGDPSKFKIVLDTKVPSLITPEPKSTIQMKYSTRNLNLIFSEKIYSVEVLNEGVVIFKEEIKQSALKYYKDNFNINIEHSALQEGINNIIVKFSDIAGNIVQDTFNIIYAGEPLEIKLLTNEEDSTLKYFYSKDYPELFQGTVYSSTQSYEFTILTNKQANCYLADNLVGHTSFDSVTNKKEFITSDFKKHIFIVNTIDMPMVWVACRNKYFENEIDYLNKFMEIPNDLIKLKAYGGDELQITDTFPYDIVTSVPYNVEARTNERALCTYSIDYGVFLPMQTTDFITHMKPSITTDNGLHSVEFDCFDVLNNYVSKIVQYEVDTTKGVKIIDYSPRSTQYVPVEVEVVISENAECRYSRSPQSIFNFYNMTLMAGSGLEREFTLSSLNEGDNIIYIYCKKDQNINQGQISILYDSSGPIISNLKFINNGMESNYLGSYNNINYKFNITSAIPVTKYFIEVLFENKSPYKTITTFPNAFLSGNFENSTMIKIIAQNEIGRNGSAYQKALIYDFSAPDVAVSVDMGKISLFCYDDLSGCYEIKYGFSDVSFTCQPIKIYQGENISVSGRNYLCAEAIDFVGNKGVSGIIDLKSLQGNETDSDGDGITDDLDNCPSINNPDQKDTDDDGTGDACDSDSDGDGISDDEDNCPLISNPDQKDADSDGIGDACESTGGPGDGDLDEDEDGIKNDDDNCPTDPNPSQIDSDGDGLGDACDSDEEGDTDGDGIENTNDNCPFDPNPSQIDTDGDGIGDACDSKNGSGGPKIEPITPINPNQNGNNDEGFNYILIVALLLVFAGIGGGGYYAYKKGYLDDQLHKMGVNRKGSKYSTSTGKSLPDFSKGGYYNQNNMVQSGIQGSKATRDLSRNTYDERLKKLNKFVDETINKKNDVFKNFDNSHRGKVEEYEDTLIKGKRPIDISKEEFDDFYKNSANKNDSELNVEKEADAFEQYHKNKEQTPDIDSNEKNENLKNSEESKKQ